MNASFHSVHTFVADTCVLIVIAYLLARGRLLVLLFREKLTCREAFFLGFALGLIGLLEAIFPDARFPYATHTLFVTFAAIAGGLWVGLITATVVILGAYLFQTPQLVLGTMLAVLVSAFLGKEVRRIPGVPLRLLGGFVVGALAQACRHGINSALATLLHTSYPYVGAWINVPANGFGVMLLLLVVSDAQARAESERRRVDAERAYALASQSQLAALRARIHPHFLFNALNSIAALCVGSDRAVTAVLRLSQLMRRTLEASLAGVVPLEEELESVEIYLQIEQERLGPRLRVHREWAPMEECAFVPPFAIQTLVENAIHHGITPRIEPGTVTVTTRRRSGHVLVAVRDDGVGMSREALRQVRAPTDAPMHGLQILYQHLTLLYGRRARLRIFSREEAGTLALFAIPIRQGASKFGKRDLR
ncbi:MAG TPA: histidine kinase [Chthonomonadaceae bacterium]|nr:histidine kinase [Chthonomonadaceae bacterium]